MAGAFFAETAVGTEAGGRGNHRPVHIGVLGLQVPQQIACGVGAIENFFRRAARTAAVLRILQESFMEEAEAT